MRLTTKKSGVGSKIGFRRALAPLCFLLVSLAIFSVVAFLFLLHKVEETKTVVGHNLEPTPWHLFAPKQLNEEGSASAIILKCSLLLTCGRHQQQHNKLAFSSSLSSSSSSSNKNCPEYFRWIHEDLSPWANSRIKISNVMEARKYAAFRVMIVDGRLYVDFYYACVQSRAMFTIWGLLQLLRRYRGKVPDVDLMFDCMDKPSILKSDFKSKPPPPLFRYCTTARHFDIPFPDWSFWGWPEINIAPWNEELRNIKEGSQALNWTMKHPFAYWKGNPDVQSPIRIQLLGCNDTNKWDAQIMRQNWVEEARSGFEQSKLSRQCDHRYKIYAEGYAWSVSLKYIISCGSLALIIQPQYDDFFSRGLMPKKNYWPIKATNICPSIKFAVDWGNKHPLEGEAIGKGGQEFMLDLDMDRVYDYMYHLIVEYSKLQDFQPFPPPSAAEICEESILCFADPKQREFLKRSYATPSSLPCTLPQPDHHIIEKLIRKKNQIVYSILKLEKMKV